MMMPKAAPLDLSRSLKKASRIVRGASPEPETSASALPRAGGQVMFEFPGADAGGCSQQGQMLTVTPAAYVPPGTGSNRSTSSTAGAVS
jgi:hypothetical protein